MNSQVISVIKKELYQRRWSIFGYSVGALLLLLLYVSIFPSFAHQSVKFNEYLKAYPKSVLKVLNIDQLQLTTIEGYVSAEHFSLVWPLVAIIFAISTAGASMAGEIEKGTMALLLSLPLGRIRLFLSKYLSGLIAMIIFLLFSTIILIPLASLFNINIQVTNVFKVTLLSAIFIWALYALSYMVSVIVSEKSRVYFAVGGLLIIMYILNIVSSLVSSLDKLKYATFFHYYAPDKALVHSQLYASSFYVFGSVIILCTMLAFIILQKRDIVV